MDFLKILLDLASIFRPTGMNDTKVRKLRSHSSSPSEGGGMSLFYIYLSPLFNRLLFILTRVAGGLAFASIRVDKVI